MPEDTDRCRFAFPTRMAYVTTTGTARSGTAILLAVVNLSLISSSSADTPSGSRHSNACSSDARINGTTRSANGTPGHSLRPDPNGMNSKDFPQKSTRSATSTSRNLSGTNSSGLSHADGSRMIAHALKMTVDPFGTA